MKVVGKTCELQVKTKNRENSKKHIKNKFLKKIKFKNFFKNVIKKFFGVFKKKFFFKKICFKKHKK